MVDLYSSLMIPEYEVIHAFPSAIEALNDLPAVLRAEINTPESGVGSNGTSHRSKIPKAIEIRLRRAKYSLAYPDHVQQPGPEEVDVQAKAFVARTNSCMQKHGLVEGDEDNVEAGLWYM